MNNNSNTSVQKVLNRYQERIKGKWRPDERFYKEVGINQKRFGMLLRGELPLYYFEAKALAKFFGVEITELDNQENPEKKVKSPA